MFRRDPIFPPDLLINESEAVGFDYCKLRLVVAAVSAAQHEFQRQYERRCLY